MHKKIKLAMGSALLMLLAPMVQAAPDNTYTQIKVFAPWDYPGQKLHPSIKVTQELKGTCWTGSVANPRPDAWRCTVDNQIFDPCFSGHVVGDVGSKVACINAPWATTAVVVTLTAPLPERKEPAPTEDAMEHSRPWAIELADSIRCVYDHTGTMMALAGIPTSSSCFKGTTSLPDFLAFNDFDQRGPLWFVFTQQGAPVLEQVPVQVAWH